MNDVRCELQYNYISDADYSCTRFAFEGMLRIARGFTNPWRIVRDDGVVIASSYDGFTPVEQAAANGRE